MKPRSSTPQTIASIGAVQIAPWMRGGLLLLSVHSDISPEAGNKH